MGFHLYDFDASTGEISNPVNIPFITDDFLTYFEFTFDGNYLYAGGNYSLYHFDLTSGDAAAIAATGTLIPIGNQIDAHATAQMGRDGNLYYVIGSTLYRIENPDNPANSIGPITALPSTVEPFYCLPQWIFVLEPFTTINPVTDTCVQSSIPFTVSTNLAPLSVA